MTVFRRDFLRLAGTGLAGAAAMPGTSLGAQAPTAIMHGPGTDAVFDVKTYGARGDGASIDTPAINKAIEAASSQGGGTVRFPSGHVCFLLDSSQEQCRALPGYGSDDSGGKRRSGWQHQRGILRSRRAEYTRGKTIRIMATIIGTIASFGAKASTTLPSLGRD